MSARRFIQLGNALLVFVKVLCPSGSLCQVLLVNSARDEPAIRLAFQPLSILHAHLSDAGFS